jgi:stringent starvation protein B
MTLTSTRPYLLRAFYDWILDNRMTPHILVDASITGVEVPVQYVKDGKVVLNVAPMAVRDLIMDKESVSFCARFNGASHEVHVPISAIEAIYSRENGKGMIFPPERDMEIANTTQPPASSPSRRPSLKLVK